MTLVQQIEHLIILISISYSPILASQFPKQTTKIRPIWSNDICRPLDFFRHVPNQNQHLESSWTKRADPVVVLSTGKSLRKFSPAKSDWLDHVFHASGRKKANFCESRKLVRKSKTKMNRRKTNRVKKRSDLSNWSNVILNILAPKRQCPRNFVPLGSNDESKSSVRIRLNQTSAVDLFLNYISERNTRKNSTCIRTPKNPKYLSSVNFSNSNISTYKYYLSHSIFNSLPTKLTSINTSKKSLTRYDFIFNPVCQLRAKRKTSSNSTAKLPQKYCSCTDTHDIDANRFQTLNSKIKYLEEKLIDLKTTHSNLNSSINLTVLNKSIKWRARKRQYKKLKTVARDQRIHIEFLDAAVRHQRRVNSQLYSRFFKIERKLAEKDKQDEMRSVRLSSVVRLVSQLDTKYILLSRQLYSSTMATQKQIDQTRLLNSTFVETDIEDTSYYNHGQNEMLEAVGGGGEEVAETAATTLASNGIQPLLAIDLSTTSDDHLQSNESVEVLVDETDVSGGNIDVLTSKRSTELETVQKDEDSKDGGLVSSKEMIDLPCNFANSASSEMSVVEAASATADRSEETFSNYSNETRSDDRTNDAAIKNPFEDAIQVLNEQINAGSSVEVETVSDQHLNSGNLDDAKTILNEQLDSGGFVKIETDSDHNSGSLEDVKIVFDQQISSASSVEVKTVSNQHPVSQLNFTESVDKSAAVDDAVRSEASDGSTPVASVVKVTEDGDDSLESKDFPRPPKYFKKEYNDPKDCYDHYKRGRRNNMLLMIKPLAADRFVEVFCDFKLGGWTILQKRSDAKVNFNATWNQYKLGFGNKYGEHWIGNELLHLLTNQDDYELRIELTNFNQTTHTIHYDRMRIGDESEGFRLYVSGYRYSQAGDSFSTHNRKKFSTHDVDNDEVVRAFGGSCSRRFGFGGWWYGKCYRCNLNGVYYRTGRADADRHDGIAWKTWTGTNESLRRVEMKIRPVVANDSTK